MDASQSSCAAAASRRQLRIPLSKKLWANLQALGYGDGDASSEGALT
jgi:hypothetical protein